MSKVLVPLAQGCEEIEAVTVVDVLRRAGVEVVTAGLAPGMVTGSHGLRLMPDAVLSDVLEQPFDMVVLPGGMPGAAHLAADAGLLVLLRRMAEAGKYVAAICAAPTVLAQAGLLRGKAATSYPGFLDRSPAPGMTYRTDAVVADGRIVTSRGPGTAMDFSLQLAELLAGEAVRREVEAGLVRSLP